MGAAPQGRAPCSNEQAPSTQASKEKSSCLGVWESANQALQMRAHLCGSGQVRSKPPQSATPGDRCGVSKVCGYGRLNKTAPDSKEIAVRVSD